jgi:ribosomal protein L37AE/L43A
LATEPSPQRAYRAACPNCGAPVDFRSAASAFAVCSFCRSTVVRDGDALRRIGQSAELFDDHSPLQLGAAGRHQGEAFTLVGRLQYRYKDGTWNEWHALFDSGKSAWLSEDNGRYVLAFDAPAPGALPSSSSLRPGGTVIIGGQNWSVASVAVAKLIAAQGELPFQPNLERAFVVADLRNTRDEVATLDYGDAAAPKWSIGQSIAISELAMTGLAESAEKTLKGRAVECPSCGTSLEVKLSTTQSIVCSNCHAVVDVSQGVGGDLKHYAQDNGSEPLIPLGSTGQLALGGANVLPWQVVGYAERCEVPEDPDDEQVFWREYLLYHRTEGFAFIVDSEDGWSWTAPITGVPERAGDGAKYKGVLYRKLYSYVGKATYVLGEFYWRLERDARTNNTDYQGTGSFGSKRLNREQTGQGDTQEVVWSAGETLSADAVLKAFKLAPEKSAALQRDALPTSGNASGLLAKVFFWAFVVVMLLILFRCDNDSDNCSALRASYGEASAEYQNCLRSNSGSGYRTGGGSFGGFSSGGGHK